MEDGRQDGRWHVRLQRGRDCPLSELSYLFLAALYLSSLQPIRTLYLSCARVLSSSLFSLIPFVFGLAKKKLYFVFGLTMDRDSFRVSFHPTHGIWPSAESLRRRLPC
jgi:hypothetical protein